MCAAGCRGIAFLLLFVLCAACGGGEPTGGNTPPGGIATVTLSTTSDIVIQDSSLALTATVRDAAGAAVSGATLTWTSSAPAIAAVSPSGVVTARTPGGAVITASAGGRSATTSILVTPRLFRIAFTVTSQTIEVKGTTTLSPSLTDEAFRPLSARPMQWRSSDERVATVDQFGVVTGRGPGSATISASREGRSATVDVAVEWPVSIEFDGGSAVRVGRATLVRAVRRDTAGNVLPLGGAPRFGSIGGNGSVAVAKVGERWVYIGMRPGNTSMWLTIGTLNVFLPVIINPNPRDICAESQRSLLLSGDEPAIFLGNLSPAGDPRSIFNGAGAVGGSIAPLSIYNPNGRYGSDTSAFSANNPSATNPPYISRNDVRSFYVTLRPDLEDGVAPQYLATCTFIP